MSTNRDDTPLGTSSLDGSPPPRKFSVSKTRSSTPIQQPGIKQSSLSTTPVSDRKAMGAANSSDHFEVSINENDALQGGQVQGVIDQIKTTVTT